MSSSNFKNFESKVEATENVCKVWLNDDADDLVDEGNKS